MSDLADNGSSDKSDDEFDPEFDEEILQFNAETQKLKIINYKVDKSDEDSIEELEEDFFQIESILPRNNRNNKPEMNLAELSQFNLGESMNTNIEEPE
eukprot:CAMPEP_0205803488 /NCGR_PEP_ID=MMETSP0205-20121125/6162_1 /ASSEMBLY_ACC=CAM_ASM_000278 /TAXON_ID=36767 /ORGANISM="Euplotes focardii, Strain TN1" /LENGTH=97 /DNA_ID=CAMNT_0053071657 /DNA_START=129 /DNA_END=422 /DNA_ORIENTATION=-